MNGVVWKTYKLLEKKQKKKMFLLIIATVIGGFLEMIGISMLLPIVDVMLSPESVTEGTLGSIYQFLRFKNASQFTIFIVIAYTVLYIFKSVYLLLMYRLQYNFVYNNQYILSRKVFNIIVNKPYSYFLYTDTASINKSLIMDVNQVSQTILSLVNICTDVINIMWIVGMLLVVEWKMTVFVVVLLFIVAWIVKAAIKPTIKRAGVKKQQSNKARIKWLNQTVGGIKEIKIEQAEEFFQTKFSKASRDFTNSEKRHSTISRVPKIFIELVCVVGIVSYIAYVSVSGVNMVGMLTQLSAFMVALIKLLPCVNTLTSSMSNLVYYEPAVEHVYELLTNESVTDNANKEISQKQIEEFELRNEISVNRLEFRYNEESPWLFENASMLIPAGSTVGIKGISGAGKSTVVDIILGLLMPQRGEVLVDGKNINDNYSSWLKKIGYIPQSIFLMDDTIRANVAFGVKDKDIDDSQVWRALEEARLAEHVRNLPEQLNTVIGERGIRLSGGQRQRIGIARALYESPELLVFDEATSALDNETEAAVMESINSLSGKKTMIIIAHRLNTIANCDLIYSIENGIITMEKGELT